MMVEVLLIFIIIFIYIIFQYPSINIRYVLEYFSAVVIFINKNYAKYYCMYLMN